MVHQFLRHETGVGVGALAHGMSAHVLHAAGDDEVGRAHLYLRCPEADGGQSARAHAVDGDPRGLDPEAGQDGGGAAYGQALVSELGRCRPYVVLYLVPGDIGIPLQQGADHLDHQVIGARLGEDAVGPGFAEGGAAGVDHVDFLQFPGHNFPSF